jgi:hypothetical protein
MAQCHFDLGGRDGEVTAVGQRLRVLRGDSANESSEERGVPDAVQVGFMVLEADLIIVSTTIASSEVKGLVQIAYEMNEEPEGFFL